MKKKKKQKNLIFVAPSPTVSDLVAAAWTQTGRLLSVFILALCLIQDCQLEAIVHLQILLCHVDDNFADLALPTVPHVLFFFIRNIM